MKIFILALLICSVFIPVPIADASVPTYFVSAISEHGFKTFQPGAINASLIYANEAALYTGAMTIVVLLGVVALLLIGQNKEKKASRQINSLNLLRQTFIDADKNLVFLKDENFKYIFVNKALADFLERTAEEIIGKDDFELLDMELAQKLRDAEKSVLDRMESIEENFLWGDRAFSAAMFPVLMTKGNYGIGSSIKEITEAQEREAADRIIYERNNILIDILKSDFENRFDQMDFSLNKILGLTDSQYGYIYYYDETTEEFVLNSWSAHVLKDCNVENPKTCFKLEETGIWGEVVRQRKPIIVNDFQAPNPLKKGYPEGHIHLERYMSVPIFSDGRIVAGVGLSNKPRNYDEDDITNVIILMSGAWQAVQRKETQNQLSHERQKYLQTLISIGDGVMVVSRDGKVEMLNSVAEKLTGWKLEEASGRSYHEVLSLSHEHPGQYLPDAVAEVFSTNQTQELSNHAVLTARDGTRYHLEDSAAPILDDKGESDGVVLVFRDVTEKQAQKRKIEYLSFHDELTGLYNRRFFEEELHRIDVERNLPISIMMADVNGLKLTNDAFGHACGDELLKLVAGTFQSSCRADDIIARWGGDEFVFLMPKTGRDEAKKIAGRLTQDVSKNEIKSIKCSVSIGIDSKELPNEEIADILRNAEGAMYSLKTLESDIVKGTEINAIIDTLHNSRAREREHSQNVSELCERFGAVLELSKVKQRVLKDAGYMHDIGKIVIPTGLLEPDRQYTEDEIAEIKKHPVAGYRILNTFAQTLNLANLVLYHHENWDGSGYPKGLKKEEIPQLARVLSIVECYERVLNEGGTQNRESKQMALDFIKDRIGTRFDPDLAALFIRMIESDDG
ncbi:MAG: diguanylate cyclase [Clostridia bacterium]|nr:diguanylate cyclase [Clostridia bacterium]